MTIYFLILFGVYFFLLIVVLAGWLVAIQKQGSLVDNQHFISVVVPYRNEQNNIASLIESLHHQDYPAHLYEVILVNDHSTDHSEQLVSSSIVSWGNFVPIESSQHGKKFALTDGIQSAKGSIIVTTDADCVHAQNWLSSIQQSFQDRKIMLSIGLVVISAKSFWSRLQRMEFYSVMSITLSALGWRSPIMCNGANLAFRREAFNQVKGYQSNLHLASGDDEFLMRDILKNYGRESIGWHDSAVTTKPQPSVKDFFRQRIRWASKWKHNSSLLSKMIALQIFIIQLAWWPLMFFSLSTGNLTLQLLVGVKVFLEFLVLFNVALHFKTRFDSLSFIALQLLYAGYVIGVGLLSWTSSVVWKDRSVM